MSFTVVLSKDAERDVDDLCAYVERHDSQSRAGYVLDRIEKALATLSDLPERGRHPPELANLGITDFREIFFKPYRLIYRVEKRRVVVHLVADGRRDMQSLLSRRLLTR